MAAMQVALFSPLGSWGSQARVVCVPGEIGVVAAAWAASAAPQTAISDPVNDSCLPLDSYVTVCTSSNHGDSVSWGVLPRQLSRGAHLRGAGLGARSCFVIALCPHHIITP